MTIATDISRRPLLPLLLALSGAHLLNDLIASMIPAMYPLFKEAYKLDFTQIGLISLAFHVTSSLLQPVLGYATDHKPWAYAMVAGMTSTLFGVLGLSFANSYAMVLVSVALVGLGSAVFHPEATRIARHAAAGHQGFAQGIFQIGGHAGYAAGPLLAALLVVPRGQASLAWMSVVALLAMVLMAWTGARYAQMRSAQAAEANTHATGTPAPVATGRPILLAMAVLVVLLLSKSAYTAAFTSYYTFYLIERFGVTVQLSQVMLFLYLVVGAFGVIVGGMVGDRAGRHRVIWISILGTLAVRDPAAVRGPVLDRRAEHPDQPDHGERVLLDPDLCDRPGAASRRSRRRAVLRPVVRARRVDGRGSRPARRPDRHHRGVQALRLAAGAGPGHVPAAPGAAAVTRPARELTKLRELARTKYTATNFLLLRAGQALQCRHGSEATPCRCVRTPAAA